jgi:hypothetical protein
MTDLLKAVELSQREHPASAGILSACMSRSEGDRERIQEFRAP